MSRYFWLSDGRWAVIERLLHRHILVPRELMIGGSSAVSCTACEKAAGGGHSLRSHVRYRPGRPASRCGDRGIARGNGRGTLECLYEGLVFLI